MPAQWSEEDLNRELTRFAELKAQSDELGEEIKTLGERIRQHYQAHDLKTVTLSGLEFTCVARKTTTYSRHCVREMDRLKNQIKAMKKIEEDNFHDEEYTGPHQCQIENITHHHMSVRQAEEKE